MKQILADIQREAGDTLGAAVYLGAGDGACLADLASLSCQRKVLVEADPLYVETLNAEAGSGVEIFNALVAASEGDALFHRFTLPFLNGPLPREHFVAFYPRLAIVESITLPTRALSSLLSQLAVAGDASNLLVMDLPSQEEALLASLTHIDTERFSHMLVRTFAADAADDSPEPSFLRHLASLGFDLVAKDAATDPAWPLYRLKKDAVKQSMQQELEKRARLLVTKATQIHQQTEQINALIAERDALATRLATLDCTHSELVTRHTSLVTESEALRSDHSELVTRHSSLVTALDDLQGQHSSLSTLHSSLVAERDDLAARHQQLATEREALQSALTAKSTLLDVLTAGRIAQDKQMEKLLQEQNSLISERDALASRVSDLMSQVEKQEAHVKLIDEEFRKAEGQIDLIKDIFLREAIR